MKDISAVASNIIIDLQLTIHWSHTTIATLDEILGQFWSFSNAGSILRLDSWFYIALLYGTKITSHPMVGHGNEIAF